MIKNLKLSLAPEIAFEEVLLTQNLKNLLKINASDKFDFILRKRSIDARSRHIKVNLEVDVFINEILPSKLSYTFDFKDVSNRPPVIIVGAGPAGLFAGRE